MKFKSKIHINRKQTKNQDAKETANIMTIIKEIEPFEALELELILQKKY
jgi:hypothetical protein